ncbi:hypothetical protein Scep_014481 [Stephania cephalantha]|uniref:Uncharacterized protein n=1 Tax=Stephania cephalantha TaxID=152367 RepID=A0AAP0P1R3_9MAGN
MSDAQNRRQGHLALAWLAIDGPLCDERGTPSMETSRDEGQCHEKLDSMEDDALAATTVVIASVEVVEPQSPGEPYHHHHHHEGTKSYIPGSLSHQKQLEDRWEVGTRIPYSVDHLGYLPLESIYARDGYIGTSWPSEWTSS